MLSLAQLFVLQELDKREAQSLNELAERTATHQSSVSVVVRRLVERGLVTWVADTEDRRRVQLAVTPAGATCSMNATRLWSCSRLERTACALRGSKRVVGASMTPEAPVRFTFLIAAVAGAALQTACTRPQPNSGMSPASASNAAGMSVGDTLAPLRQRAVASLLQRIAGRENEPAEKVFQNVKVLRGVPAGRFLEIMNDGFGHGLGVSCGFCHVPGQWASDQKPNKMVARDMIGMVNRVNTDLHGMSDLPDAKPTIGCITCHRMSPKPMLVNMH